MCLIFTLGLHRLPPFVDLAVVNKMIIIALHNAAVKT